MTTINKTTIKGFDTLLKEGASRDKLEGFLLFEGIGKKDAIAYLKERGLIGAQTFRSWLVGRCNEGFLGADEFVKRIEGESNNTRNHIKTYDNERRAYNAIHAKYSKDIEQMVADELAAAVVATEA